MQETTLLIDNYVSTKPGEAYRLFPFGVVIKNGKRHKITPGTAATFSLPHFKPPIKLGSHEETTPAGGHIIALSVRGDGNCELCKIGMCAEHGLFATPEVNDSGERAITDGAYRYHSPEVIWEDGYLEDPTTGKPIMGPLIVGDALLHTPHLGEATALYSVEVQRKDGDQMTDMTQVPTTLWDKFTAWFNKRVDEAEAPASAPAQIPEEYQAKIVELEQYKARIQTMEAEQAKRARVDQFEAELKDTRVNAGEWAALLVDIPAESAEKIVVQFKALSAQIAANDKLTAVIGTTGTPEATKDPNQVVLAYAAEHKVGYVEAFEAVRKATPEIFR
jgi:hypothetical protein